MLETKEFPVKYVNPSGTSQHVILCRSRGGIYGIYKRIFKCSKCGLKDFNLDLNAAKT